MFKRLILTVVILPLLVGGGIALRVIPAQAAIHGICDDAGYCLNAWNGGPLIKAYTNGVANDSFKINGVGTDLYNIQFTGGNNEYLGDYQNSKTDAKAGLVGSGGWGGGLQLIYTTGCPGEEFAIWDNHWQGYLIMSDSDGAQVYLNATSGSCFINT
jgi:hypothetical protein